MLQKFKRGNVCTETTYRLINAVLFSSALRPRVMTWRSHVPITRVMELSAINMRFLLQTSKIITAFFLFLIWPSDLKGQREEEE
jgi:hypothetical protein